MTEATAVLLAAIITSLGTITAVSIGVFSFKGRVKDVESALGEITDQLEVHQQDMNQLMTELTEQATTTLQRLNAVKQELDERETEPLPVGVEQVEETTRKKLNEQWHRVRDQIEDIAADEDIDGRTRAMYARRDRRSYWQLLQEMADRNHLPGGRALYDEALELWMSFKNRKNEPTDEDVTKMTELADQISRQI